MLVGRAAERAVIARLLAGARVGRSGVLVLVGEPGIGKTALLDHAFEQATDARVLRAVGSHSEHGVAFAGLHQVIRPLAGLLGAIPDPQAQALEVALALRDGESRGRFAVGAATLSLLSRAADDSTLVLLVDDAHLLDRPSTETLAFVARRLMADRIAILAAARPGDDSPLLGAGLPERAVRGLLPDEVGQLLTAHTGRPASRSVVDRLHQTTLGNPLGVVELAGDLDALAQRAPGVPVRVPDAVAKAFGRRAAELSDAARWALLLVTVANGDLALAARAAAVPEVSAHPGLGAEAAVPSGASGVAPPAAGLTALTEAEAAGLLRIAPGSAQFRHPLVRSSVYSTAPAEDRRAAHRAVAAALPDPEIERRAWHLCEAAVGVDDEVAELLHRAGDRAAARSAHDTAATAYERAARLSTAPSRQAERLLAAGRSSWLAGEPLRADQLLARSARLADAPVVRAAADGDRGAIAGRAGSLSTAVQLLTDAAERVAPVDPDTAVRFLADGVDVCFYLADARLAARLSDRIDALLESTAEPESRARGEVAVGVAAVLGGQAGIERIRTGVAALATLPRRPGDPGVLRWEMLGSLYLREPGAGRAVLEQHAAELRRQTALGTLPVVLFYLGRDQATTARWDDAAATYQEGIALAREAGESTDLAVTLAALAWLQARTGRVDESRRHAAEAKRLAAQHDIRLAGIWARFALGDLATAHGESTAAVEQFDALQRQLDALGFRDVDMSPGPELAEALMRTGDRDRAQAVAARYHGQAADKGQPWALARSNRALATTAGDRDAARYFGQALELHEAALDVYEEARTRWSYGAWLRRARQRRLAREHLRAAVRLFDELGARPWADRAAAELAATGETIRRRGEGPLAELTAQELQIARALGTGSTTREAAAALFLSPKTVEYHLRHIYTKLGVRSRPELAAVVAGSRDRPA